MPKLRSIKGELVGKEFPIGAGKVLMGRRESNAVVLNHNKVSRSHAEVVREGDRCVVRDLNSSNGTFLNGIKLPANKPRVLSPGDEIRIADTILRYFDSDTALPDITIPGHEIIDVIAEGGMGTIYRARQTSMDREVAVKILNPEYASRKEFVGRFIQEARAAGKLNHPNIIQVHNVGKVGEGCYYFTMELVDGLNLTQRLGAREGLDIKTVINAGIKVADALDYAHERGVIHRDIKPDNIVISSAGDVKLADLGIAKTVEHQEEDGTRKRVLGTPHYMSPEQASGKAVDGRSDLYSLGATLYHVLSGQPIFDAPKSTEVMTKHVRETPKRLTEVAPEVPAAVCKIVDKLLEKNPSDRYQTAAEARDALAKVLEGLEKEGEAVRKRMVAAMQEPVESPRPSAAARTPRGPSTTHKLAQFGVFAGVAAVVLFVGYLVVSSPPANNHHNHTQQNGPVGPTPKEKAWEEAESLRRQGRITEARAKYSIITSRYADDSVLVSNAQRAIDEIDKEQRRQDHARKAREAWDEFLAFKRRNSNDIDALQSRLNALERKYDSLKDKVAAELALIDKARAIEAAGRFHSFEANFNTMLRGKNFDGALAAIVEFQGRNAGSPELAKLPPLRAKVNTEAEAALAEFQKEIEKLRAANNLKGMSLKCDSFEQSVTYAKAKPIISSIRSDISAKIAGLFAPLAQAVRNHLDKREYALAENALNKRKIDFLGTPFMAKVKEMEALVRGLQALHHNCIRKINTADPWLVPDDYGIDLLKDMTIVSADQHGLKVKKGIASTTVKWDKLTHKDIAKLYERYIPASDKDDRKYLELYKKMFAP